MTDTEHKAARDAEALARKITAQVLATLSDGGNNLDILNAVRRCVGAKEQK